jgi:hypothetical protein
MKGKWERIYQGFMDLWAYSEVEYSALSPYSYLPAAAVIDDFPPVGHQENNSAFSQIPDSYS